MPATPVHPDDRTVVATTLGRVRGRREHGMLAWRGIPYAAPPVGDLRLRAPRPATPWDGIRDATTAGAVPPQPRTSTASGAGFATRMDEDCLTIGVLRRATPPAAPRPVMVFIYGGAFAIGSAAATAYDGARLVADGDVVFVGFNYRLGALGWLDLSRYGTAARPIDSNLGLRDQLAALRWVHDNIAAFGGDPDNVTLFGESAGGTSVATLLTVPDARGLFARAIVQSSGIGSVAGPQRTAAWAERFVTLLGPPEASAPEASAADRLLSATPDELVRALALLEAEVTDDQPGARVLGPVVDGVLLPTHPLDAFRDGDSLPVPLIIGTNADEGTLFQLVVRALAGTPARVDRLFALTDPGARPGVLAGYPGYPRRRSIAELVTDLVFWHPSVTAAAGHAQVAPTWMYRFDFAPPLVRLLGLGATHAAELDFVFGRPDSLLQRLGGLLGGRRAARAVTVRMHGRWLAFARRGVVAEDWPQYDGERRLTLIIDESDRVEADPRGEIRPAWDSWTPYR
ncbi:carboxylesterase/lipase family protein [uncultured Amnibacterium sp.]|uniref:carboxylesterase/lipase family protein n=1 Tax=uncultured Amnibacterium sp. TaxID=1631851 RepID=UPI0035C97D69